MYRTLVVAGALFTTACTADGGGHETTRIEGRTAAVSGGAALFALRLWATPELDSLLRAGVRVDSMAVAPRELRLRRGDRLPLSSLNVVAIDSAGRPVLAAPVVLEIDAAVIALTPLEVIARARGHSILRIRSLLPASGGGEANHAIRVSVE